MIQISLLEWSNTGMKSIGFMANVSDRKADRKTDKADEDADIKRDIYIQPSNNFFNDKYIA